MRDLEQSNKNILTIKDAISGTDIELYYRLPSTSERVAYQSRLISHKGGKIQVHTLEARLEYGLKILTGFREGDFGVKGRPISSDPQNQNYHENWKELIRAMAADIVNAFAFVVFEGAAVNAEPEPGTGTEGEGAEERPL